MMECTGVMARSEIGIWSATDLALVNDKYMSQFEEMTIDEN